MPDGLPVSLLMFIAARTAENRILQAVQRAGYHDITVAQARIAARIGPNGTRLGELAEQAQVAKQTATALVDRLERAGYVERTVDPADARARLVRIGRAAAPKIIPIARAEEARSKPNGPNTSASAECSSEALNLLREITDSYQTPAGPG
jgi:DNA-binding MarR family transcriptional regulator